MFYKSVRVFSEGGKGSGNFGHDGRPGKVGGSMPQHSPWSRGLVRRVVGGYFKAPQGEVVVGKVTRKKKGEIKETLQRVPDKYTTGLEIRTASKSEISGCNGVYNFDTRTGKYEIILDPKAPESSLYHEIGHHVQVNGLGNVSDREWKDLWRQIAEKEMWGTYIDKGKVYGIYSSTDHGWQELAADIFTMWHSSKPVERYSRNLSKDKAEIVSMLGKEPF